MATLLPAGQSFFLPPAQNNNLTMFTGAYPGQGANPGVGVAGGGSGGSSASGSGSSVGGSNGLYNASSINDFVRQITEVNNANIGNATQQGAQLAIQNAQQLDPVMAERFYNNLNTALPGYQDMVAQMQSNTQQFLQGGIPDDVADMVRMFSAEQNQQGAHAGTARNLGLTSLDMTTRGHQQGLDLLSASKNFLTPPTTNIEGNAADIRNQMINANTLTPAQGLNVALQKRNQDMQMAWKAEDNLYRREALMLEADMFNAKMDWNRDLSQMNKDYADLQYKRQMEVFSQVQAARRSEQGSYASGFKAATDNFDKTPSIITGGKDTPAPRTNNPVDTRNFLETMEDRNPGNQPILSKGNTRKYNDSFYNESDAFLEYLTGGAAARAAKKESLIGSLNDPSSDTENYYGLNTQALVNYFGG